MYQMIVVIMFYNHVIQKESDFLDVQILTRTFNRSEKSQNNGGGIRYVYISATKSYRELKTYNK